MSFCPFQFQRSWFHIYELLLVAIEAQYQGTKRCLLSVRMINAAQPVHCLSKTIIARKNTIIKILKLENVPNSSLIFTIKLRVMSRMQKWTSSCCSKMVPSVYADFIIIRIWMAMIQIDQNFWTLDAKHQEVCFSFQVNTFVTFNQLLNPHLKISTDSKIVLKL